MRKATLMVTLILLGMTTMLFGRLEVLGPDLDEIAKSVAKHNTVDVNRPWSNHNDVIKNSEIVPGKGTIEPSSPLRFEYKMDYAGLETGDVGSAWGGFIFGPSDSALVWFRPSTECKINEVSFLHHTDNDLTDKTVFVQIWSVKDEAWGANNEYGGNGTYDFTWLNETFGDERPMDELLLTAPVSVGDVSGYNDAYVVDVTQWTDDNLPLDVGSNDFLVTLAFPDNIDPDLADLYYGSLYDDVGQYHGFKYYSGTFGWRSRFTFSITATVDYYGDPPPFIEEISDLDDVYLSADPGPYETEAFIYDLGSGTFPGALSNVSMYYTVNGVADTVDLSLQIPAADSVYTYGFADLAVGDYVEYFWHAEDNGADDEGGITHAYTTFPLNFTVREAGEDVAILILNDNTTQIVIDEDNNTETIAMLYYAPILDAGGWAYDYWDVNVSGTPSAGVLANYTSLLWVQANSGAGILDFVDVGAYLDAGGNLFLASADFIGDARVEDDFGGIWTAATNPFLINYLHVTDFVSDANPTEEAYVGVDTLYQGEENSPISGDYFEVDFEIDVFTELGLANYNDEVIPDGDSEVAFWVFSDGDDALVEAGTVYDGAYKSIFLPFPFSAILDDDIRMDIMANVLAFFGEKAAPLVKYEGGNRYAQAANAGDITVYGSATDGDGTVVSLGVDYTLDDGVNYTSVAMTDGMATIPALTVGDDCYYMITATDNDGLIGVSEMINVYKIDFTPSADILYVGDEAFTWYYGAKYDSVNYDRTVVAATAAGLTIEYWDYDVEWLMDGESVLDQYDAVIWNSYFEQNGWHMPVATIDNPLANYDGKILYSSEEIIGAWFGWPQYQDFYAGDVMYDVFGVNWAGNDLGLDSIGVYGGMYTAGLDTFNLLSSAFYGGNMNDYCDPIPFWGGDYASGPFTAYGGADWGWNPNSAVTENTMFLAFSMMMMPDDVYATFMGNWMGTLTSVDRPSALPREFALANNYPNPFNPSTTIAFDVPNSSEVMISVYNLLGQKVIDLVNSEYTAGTYDVQWNGLNAAGNPVSSGIYMYKMTAGNYSATSKMLFLK